MTTGGKELDTLIREALSRDEQELFDRLGEPTLPALMTEAFRGRLRWLNLYAGLLTFGFFALAVVSAVMIFRVDDVAEMLRWGLGFAFGLATTLALKVWFWMEMQRHALTREVKRVELALVHLANELRSRGTTPT